jgi:hypothetical protein
MDFVGINSTLQRAKLFIERFHRYLQVNWLSTFGGGDRNGGIHGA